MRELGSGNSEGRPSSQPSSQPGSKNEGRPPSRPSSQVGSRNKGSGDSFDPTTAFVVDLPKSDVRPLHVLQRDTERLIGCRVSARLLWHKCLGRLVDL